MKKQKITPEQKAKVARQKSFQERLPILKIKNRLFVTKKNEYLPVFVLGQRAVDLMSEDEVYEFSQQLERTFQTLGITKIQFLLLPVPFDLAPYELNQKRRFDELRNQEASLRSAIGSCFNFNQRAYLEDELAQNLICQKYIDNQSYFVTRNLQSGRVANKHTYVICSIKESYNETAVQEAARQIESALKSIADDSHRCSEEEMEKILIELYNPLRPEIYINS